MENENQNQDQNQNMIRNNMMLVFAFLKKNPILILAGIVVVCFFSLIFFSFLSSSQQNSSTNPSPGPSETTHLSPTVSSGKSPNDEPNDKDFEKKWQEIPFSKDDFQKINAQNEALSNGSIKYTYASENPQRPNVTIVKDNVAIAQRTLMFNYSLTNLTAYLGKPDYIASGSKFWGANAVIYIYFERGLAYTLNPQTQEVYEQFEFKPVPPDQFKQTYGDDIDMIGDLKKQ